MQHPTRIEMDERRSYEIRPVGDGQFAAVLVTADKPDYEVRRYPSHREALHAATRWAQAEIEQTAILRDYRDGIR